MSIRSSPNNVAGRVETWILATSAKMTPLSRPSLLRCPPGRARAGVIGNGRRASSRARAGTQSGMRQPAVVQSWVPGLASRTLARDDSGPTPTPAPHCSSSPSPHPHTPSPDTVMVGLACTRTCSECPDHPSISLLRPHGEMGRGDNSLGTVTNLVSRQIYPDTAWR